eukprot:jgi/Psemu1/28608/gm1.28608_g
MRVEGGLVDWGMVVKAIVDAVFGAPQTILNFDTAIEKMDAYLKAECQPLLKVNVDGGFRDSWLYIYTTSGRSSIQFNKRTPPELLRGDQFLNFDKSKKNSIGSWLQGSLILTRTANKCMVGDRLFCKQTRDIFCEIFITHLERLIHGNNLFTRSLEFLTMYNYLPVGGKLFTPLTPELLFGFVSEDDENNSQSNGLPLREVFEKISVPGFHHHSPWVDNSAVNDLSQEELPAAPLNDNFGDPNKQLETDEGGVTNESEGDDRKIDTSAQGPKMIAVHMLETEKDGNTERKDAPNMSHIENLGYLIQVPCPPPTRSIEQLVGNVKVVLSDVDPKIKFPCFPLGSKVKIKDMPPPKTRVVKSYAYKKKDQFPTFPGYMECKQTNAVKTRLNIKKGQIDKEEALSIWEEAVKYVSEEVFLDHEEHGSVAIDHMWAMGIILSYLLCAYPALKDIEGINCYNNPCIGPEVELREQKRLEWDKSTYNIVYIFTWETAPVYGQFCGKRYDCLCYRNGHLVLTTLGGCKLMNTVRTRLNSRKGRFEVEEASSIWKEAPDYNRNSPRCHPTRQAARACEHRAVAAITEASAAAEGGTKEEASEEEDTKEEPSKEDDKNTNNLMDLEDSQAGCNTGRDQGTPILLNDVKNAPTTFNARQANIRNEELSLLVTPLEIYRWMCKRVCDTEDPGHNGNPTMTKRKESRQLGHKASADQAFAHNGKFDQAPALSVGHSILGDGTSHMKQVNIQQSMACIKFLTAQTRQPKNAYEEHDSHQLSQWLFAEGDTDSQSILFKAQDKYANCCKSTYQRALKTHIDSEEFRSTRMSTCLGGTHSFKKWTTTMRSRQKTKKLMQDNYLNIQLNWPDTYAASSSKLCPQGVCFDITDKWLCASVAPAICGLSHQATGRFKMLQGTVIENENQIQRITVAPEAEIALGALFTIQLNVSKMKNHGRTSYCTHTAVAPAHREKGPARVDAAPTVPEGRRPATLYNNPRVIQARMHQDDCHTRIIERNTPAREFTAAVEIIRKVVLGCMRRRLLYHGTDVNTSIQNKIQRVYHGDMLITKLQREKWRESGSLPRSTSC